MTKYDVAKANRDNVARECGKWGKVSRVMLVTFGGGTWGMRVYFERRHNSEPLPSTVLGFPVEFEVVGETEAYFAE